ncbi:MAG: hypothetical protein HKO92_04220 [Flavobacteriaceae bacterium]|nr:hypothetical protein [Flavobacteriaceae bacterium]
MKKLILTIIVLLSFSFLFAQTESTIKMVNSGSLVEVTIYYNNGKIMQHGFMTPKNQLQDKWESYYEDGTLKCEAFYKKGKKVGVWHYYYPNANTKRVTYKDNKIVNVEELEVEKTEESEPDK